MDKLLLFFIILTGLLLPISVKFGYFQPLTGSLMDLLHVPIGVIVAWILKNRVFSAVCVIIGIECLQHFTGRNLSVLDTLLGISGVLIFYKRYKLWPLILAPILFTAYQSFGAYLEGVKMRDAFPLIYKAQVLQSEKFWYLDNKPILKLTLPSALSDGWRSLELRLWGADWSNCQTLIIRVDSETNSDALIRVDDTRVESPKYDERFNMSVSLIEGKNRLILPLKDVQQKVTLKSISRLIVATNKNHPALTMREVRLDCNETS